MNKVLTVVVPTYNMEKYLNRCLDSLIIDSKSMDLLEVLIINDGSKDRSSEIAHTYELRYPDTFRVIDKENGNYGSCVNRGLMEASGKYFRLLDADDWFDTEMLRKLIDELSVIDVDLVITPFNYIEENKTELFAISNYLHEGSIYPLESISPNDILLRMHSMTYKLELLKTSQLCLSCGVSYTDTEYCFFPLKYVSTVAFYDYLLYQYDASRPGQTCSKEALKRSTKSLYTVGMRLANYYLDNHSEVFIVVEYLWQKLLCQVSGLYYSTSLVLCKEDDDVLLREYDDIVKQIPTLNSYISELCRHHIHYVRMWRRTGRRYSCFLCKIHDSIWSVLDAIWLYILRHFSPSRL